LQTILKTATLVAPFLEGQQPTKKGSSSTTKMTESAYPGSVFYCLKETGGTAGRFSGKCGSFSIFSSYKLDRYDTLCLEMTGCSVGGACFVIAIVEKQSNQMIT